MAAAQWQESAGRLGVARGQAEGSRVSAIGRQCNECTLCCRLLPVKEFKKLANQRCTHQRAKGCAVHERPDYPVSCRLWSCMWLTGADTEHLPRPDRAHYVIDPTPDFVEFGYSDGSLPVRLLVVQVWVDPKHPQAHEDPALRAWLERRAQRNEQAALIRYSGKDAFLLIPPALTRDGTWRVMHGTGTVEHTAREKLETVMAYQRRAAPL